MRQTFLHVFAFLGAAYLLAVTLGCHPPVVEVSRVETLTWELKGDYEVPPVERLAEAAVQERRAPWQVRADEVLYLEGRQVLRGAAPRRWVWDGPFDLRRATHFEVTGVFRQPQVLQLHAFDSKQNKLVLGPSLEIGAGTEERTVLFELSSLNLPEALRLAVLATGPGMETQLKSLALIRVPITRQIPLAGRGRRWLQRGAQVRGVSALVLDVPIETSFTVPPNGRLEIDWSLAPGDVSQGIVRRVGLTLEGEGLLRRYWQQLDDVDRDGWRRTLVNLTGLEGRTVRLTARLQQGVCEAVAVGSPRVVQGQKGATVVLITSDTHRGDHLGVLAKGLDTPTLDSWAQRGVVFLDCLATANNTNPSHAALFTGRSPRDTGITQNGMRLLEDAPTLAEAFRSAGYRTWAAVSVDHLTPGASGLGQGFERIFVPPDAVPVTASQTIARVRAALEEEPEGPLFLWLHLFDAHGPYEAPREFVEPAFRSLSLSEDEVRAGWPQWTRGHEDPEHLRALYRAEVAYLDEALGSLAAHPRFQDQELILAFTSDHGEVLEGETRPLFDHIGLAPATLKVPLILLFPGVRGGTRVPTPVRHEDVGRTLLDLAGLEALPFPGRDLRVGAQGPRFAIEGGTVAASVQEGRWMLDLNLVRREGRELHAIRLFDLHTDPWAQRDVAQDHREEAQRLRASLVSWLVAAPEDTWSRRAPALNRARLAQLGYSDGVQPQGRLFDDRCLCDQCASWHGSFSKRSRRSSAARGSTKQPARSAR